MDHNAAINKVSPLLPLTHEQHQLVDQIETFIAHHIQDAQPAVFTVYGDAGTGKSVVLSHLFNDLETAARTDAQSPVAGTTNYFLVNHPEVLKVYRNIAGQQKHLYKKDFERPTTLINRLEKSQTTADVVVIDEAHLLLSKPDHYNNFYGTNQLSSLLQLAHVIVLVFDETQVLRMKSFWTEERLEKLLAPYTTESVRLTHQFRMTASDQLVDWINQLTHRHLEPLPKDAGTDYDLRIYADAEQMRRAIVQRNHEVGLARIVSTSGYPSTLDGGKHYITEGKFHLPWDQYNYTSVPWAEIPATINEVGSIYTCQGFDLNYVGIILGPPIQLDPATHQLVVDLDKYTDVEAFKHRQDLTDPDEIHAIEVQMILNSINVLMKRGIHGMYLFAHDPVLRQYLLTHANGHAQK
ncbi:hypothetical protein IV38_GL001602 [Lactobacillus selangorensis]|uniref:Schlafen group 3-like DNA/RNA helicase domain-containing protein n=1 Tax=Lactobacillus selangorensis TaxID=81857 RepID=A0A0R2FSA8_9LACO|nr:DUF2075 domain-containing protein [Lactobacillus selangorensis]KRN28150.1 hypothetical protein IV38_GL001602 [Lactobacillus selangorensis]KRN30974.1 hypothetical protein IV40_GL001613 [Lactobacillus selangorensis]